MLSEPSKRLPSFRERKPTEEGGPIARAGFAYQDHVAAHFCLSLLNDPMLIEVWCETYDDIVLIRLIEGTETMEFIQVKADVLDQLWTLAKLCARESGKEGTSIFERSLTRAAYKEKASFRMVTLRPIGKELSVLSLNRCHEDRINSIEIQSLTKDLEQRFQQAQSPAGHGACYWVDNVEWESFGQREIADSNKLTLKRHLESLGIYAPSDTLTSVYETLIARIKGMSELRNADHDKKVMTRAMLIELLRKAEDPFPDHLPSAKLEAKLAAARCDPVCISQAQDLRRAYRKTLLTRPFLNLGEENDKTEVAILGNLHRLLSAYDSGRSKDSSDREFHATCVESVEALSVNLHVGRDQLTTHDAVGCMYEITSRCRHRFTKATP
ncbi:MAG TPA: hypothetical protein DCP71_13290 [Verrucomicrobiales bacterium]|jgi:hypothetical protein|nr:hypothetical protein [Verrucomicrobiales bacterium]